jgi:hypothetical protein
MFDDRVRKLLFAIRRRWAKATADGPIWRTVTSFAEYEAARSELADIIAEQRRFERELARSGEPFDLGGFCYPCARRVPLRVDYQYSGLVDGVMTPNWRERLECPHCRLNNRMRAAVHLLTETGLKHPVGRVYMSEQTTPLYRELCAQLPNGVVGSEFLGTDRVPGSIDEHGIRHESVCHLSFEDGSFSAILSFDVLEHVPDYRKALSEMCRCLEPGGRFVLSVPFRPDSASNLVRARLGADGQPIHLLPPEYHGDPMRTEGCLAYYHFGWQLLDELRDAGFDNVRTLFYWSRAYGYLGSDQLLILANKPRH